MENLKELKNRLAKENEIFSNMVSENGIKNNKDLKPQLAVIKDLQEKFRIEEIKNKINSFNKQNKEKRNVLKSLLKLPIIKSELVTNDGKLNKNKRKGNEEIYDFFDKSKYYTVKFKNNGCYSVYMNGSDFDLFDNSGVKFEDLKTACENNYISFADKKLSTVLKQIDKLKKESEKVLNILKKYNDFQIKNDSSFLTKEGFLTTNDRYFYEMY